MDYKNRLKGAITQVLIKSLLVDAGYHVVPLGIEEVIREVNSLSRENYLAWDLPTPLRKMPDFFVIDKEYKRHYLVEVKYRKYWNEATFRSLHKELLEQVRCWGTIFLLAVSCKSNNLNPTAEETPAQFLRCVVLYMDDDVLSIEGKDPVTDNTISMYLDERRFPEWNCLYRVQEIFKHISDKHTEKLLKKRRRCSKVSKILIF